MAVVNRSRLLLLLVLLVVIAGVWRLRRPAPQPSVAYVADRSATVWDTTAQVRQPIAELGYGEKVAVLRRSGDRAQVRTEDGTQGWMDGRLLMDPALWQQSEALLARARSLPVQALGHTRTLSNVHLEPGRDTQRIFQFGRNVPVVVLERRVAPAPASPPPEGASDEPASPDDSKDAAKPKDEDWLLVSRADPPGTQGTGATASATPAPAPAGSADGANAPVAGWVLGRFIELDPPQPIPDYSNAAGTRVVAWATLNTVPDGSEQKAQYLVAGARGGEGHPCDFTSLRVYTWDAARQRYETAFVESDLCGMLPIQAAPSPDGAEFRFPEAGASGAAGAERVYRMKQTIVRRVNTGATAPGKRRKAKS